MIVMVIVCALIGAIVGCSGAGFGAASVLISALGGRDGGPAMAGFYIFGPIGGLAGALFGAGLALQFGGGSPWWSKGLLIAAVSVAGVGGLMLALTVSPPDRGPSYSYVIEFQLEVPAAALAGVNIPGPNAMWGAAGGDSDDKPISQFFEKTCDGNNCVLNGSVAALGEMHGFRIMAAIGPNKYRCPLNLPAMVNAPVDWSDWRSVDDARVRWRIVKR